MLLGQLARLFPKGTGGDMATAEAVWPGRGDNGLREGPAIQWLTHTLQDRPGPPLLDVNTRSLNTAVLATKMDQTEAAAETKFSKRYPM